jgi:hypothetical protein
MSERNDNQGNPELMISQQAELDNIIDDIHQSEMALNLLVEEYAEAKAKIHKYLAQHFDEAQAKTKKTAGMDVFLLWSASQSEELQEAYEVYIRMRKKAQIHTAILESKGRRLSGQQSKMKNIDWRKQ